MKLFKCNNCGQPVYFENYICLKCNAQLGFDPEQMELVALKEVEIEPKVAIGLTVASNQEEGGEMWHAEGQPAQREIAYAILGLEEQGEAKLYKYCSNKNYNVCNWLLPYQSDKEFCVACHLNHTIPNLSATDHLEKWSRIEVAKHRLVYSLLRFKLPIISKFDDANKGIAFDFMAEDAAGQHLLTGHDHGLITLNIAEADDVIREMARNQMEEVYRTLLGHFRHEIGHYYWERLIEDTDRLPSFRQLFGNETIDYGEALKAHYAKPHSNAWQTNFISAYASSHPWEDWAETWAHYLHIIDTMETGYSFGLRVKPRLGEQDAELNAKLNIDPYNTISFEDIIERWIPLTYVMNSLNRSMGLKDSYPFVINEAVKEKLTFIHETVSGARLKVDS